MKIKVLGPGCSKCKALYATVERVINESGIEATLEKEEDLQKIMEYNTMTLPAIVINEKVVGKGLLSDKEVKSIIESYKD